MTREKKKVRTVELGKKKKRRKRFKVAYSVEYVATASPR